MSSFAYGFALGVVTVPTLAMLAVFLLLGWIIIFDPIVFPDGNSKSIED